MPDAKLETSDSALFPLVALHVMRVKGPAMESFKVKWVGTDGRPRRSVVAYGGSAAAGRKRELEASGARGVEIVPVKLGE